MKPASGKRSCEDLKLAALTLLRNGVKTNAEIRKALSLDLEHARRILRSLRNDGEALMLPHPPISRRPFVQRARGGLWVVNPNSPSQLMLEKNIESQICEYAVRLGVASYKFTSPGNNGVPDRIFVFQGGRVAFMEIKRPGQKPTTLQLAEISKLRKRGCLVAWFDNGEDACRWLCEIYNAK